MLLFRNLTSTTQTHVQIYYKYKMYGVNNDPVYHGFTYCIQTTANLYDCNATFPILYFQDEN